jgi:hypothetical protein
MVGSAGLKGLDGGQCRVVRGPHRRSKFWLQDKLPVNRYFCRQVGNAGLIQKLTAFTVIKEAFKN